MSVSIPASGEWQIKKKVPIFHAKWDYLPGFPRAGGKSLVIYNQIRVY